MAHEIFQHIPAINRTLNGTGWSAKRSRVNPHEIIIGMNSDTPKCVTVILADNPSDINKPTWYVGLFPTTTPKELSNSIEAPENPVLQTATYWNDMLRLVKQFIA